MRTHGRSCLLCVLLTVVVALPLTAIVQPGDSAIRDKTFQHPDLYIGNTLVPAGEVGNTRASQALADLGVSPAGAYMDKRSGQWSTLILSQALLPGAGRGNELSWEQLGLVAPGNSEQHRLMAWDAFLGYLNARQSTLGIDTSELVSPGSVTVHNGGDLVQIHVRRQIDGVPVRGSFLTATINRGNLVILGAHNWGDIGISTAATISADAAVGVASNYLGEVAEGANWRKSSLIVLPMAKGADPRQIAFGEGYSHRLAWVLRPAFAGDSIGDWEALIDAHNGDLLAFEDHTKYEHEHARGGGITREVQGGVLPISNDGVGDDGTEQPGFAMPFADLTNAGTTSFTDAGGNLLACVEGDVTTTLSGPFLTMVDTCGEISETTSGAVLDLGTSGGTDCATPPGASPGNTHASRSGYYELNRSVEWGRSHLPDNTWVRQPLTATMNIDANCNASGGAGGVNFFTSGGGCSNTGELAGVFVHEWGHGMDASDATPGFSNPAEGIADVYAALRLNTSCMGRNFRPGSPCGGYGDPCTTCTGVRDIDWANRASGLPHGIDGPTGIDALCPGGGGPCGGSIHCEGAVFAESVWDLFNRDLQSNYGMSLNTARELTTRLNFVGSGAVTNFFSCTNGTGVGDGCNADSGYLQFLAANDDDGDLMNGTPHMEAIFEAFDRHDIACPTPTVVDSGCTGTPTTAPTVTATPRDRGVSLSWPAVSGASSYRVFRTEGVHACDFGKIWVGDTTDTSFIDSGLKNGQEHYYIVTAMGPGDSCFGPASSCTTVVPVAGANLALDPASSGAVAFGSGDGDAFLDNCEEVAVTVAAANIGTGNQTNVRITGVRTADPGIQIGVLSTLPLTVSASMATCDIASTDVDVVFGGLDLGDVVDLEIDFTSDELAGLIKTQTVRLAVPGTEGDSEFFATKTFSYETDLEDWQVAEGIFGRSGTGGGDGTTFFVDSADGLDFQCDRIRSPAMSLSATSTLSLWNNYDIEPLSGGTWYDRANVGIIDSSGGRTLVTPDGGRLYNADSSGPGNYGGCNEPEEGWADTMDTWGTSTWTDTALQSSTFAGDFIQLEVIYGTDAALAQRGFWFDQVTVTNVDLQVADTQSDACFDAGIFADGFESGDTSAWSATIQ